MNNEKQKIDLWTYENVKEKQTWENKSKWMSMGGECCWMLTFVKWLLVVWLNSRLLSLFFLIFPESISAVIAIFAFLHKYNNK